MCGGLSACEMARSSSAVGGLKSMASEHLNGQAESEQRSLRVAIVEDSDAVRATLRAALERAEGVELAVEAKTGAEGLVAIAEAQPDVAVLNIGLPDMDGVELTRQVKEQVPETRVAILTGSEREDVVLAAIGAGADAYCRKDGTGESLLLALEQMQEGNSWLDPQIAHVVLDQLRSDGVGEAERVAIAADSELSDMLEVFPLTERELEVLGKIVDGCSNAEIGEDLEIGMGTVKTHVRNILHKLCASDRTQAAVRALRAGLVK